MEKRIDESWKDKVSQEKREEPAGEHTPEQGSKQSPEQTQEQSKDWALPPVGFAVFISSLGMQALMSLGEIENPVTGKVEKDLAAAKYLIDTIGMLEEKTRGNLSESEKQTIEHMLYELRTKYVGAAK